MVATSKPAIVQAGEQTIYIGSGTVVLLSKHGSVIKVRNLWESRAGTVKVQFGKHSTDICAGKEVVIGKDSNAVYQAMQQDNVGRRRVREISVGNQAALSTAEVSIASMLKESQLLEKLRASTEKSDKSLVDRVMKMAACLQYSTGKHGQYTNLQH